jgi:hypothetical protein
MNAPLRIEYLPLAGLQPYDRNARTHSTRWENFTGKKAERQPAQAYVAA